MKQVHTTSPQGRSDGNNEMSDVNFKAQQGFLSLSSISGMKPLKILGLTSKFLSLRVKTSQSNIHHS